MHRESVRLISRLCIAALLLQACATAGLAGDLEPEEDAPEGLEAAQTEADPPPPWETRGEQEDEEARRAEAAAALSGMRGVLSTVEEEESELVFRFWAQNGALTLLSWKRTTRGTGQAGGKADTFLPGLEANLLTYSRKHTGEVRLTLRRQRQDWRLSSYSTVDTPKPREAKTLPVRRAGVTAETLTQAHAVASRLARSLQVPEGGSTTVLAEVHLDDDRVLDAREARPVSPPRWRWKQPSSRPCCPSPQAWARARCG
jgi:hypothetical protein